MTKILVIALFAATLLALAMQSVPPVTAAAVSPSPTTPDVSPMPPPQAPFDTTPISAVETVGAARGE